MPDFNSFYFHTYIFYLSLASKKTKNTISSMPIFKNSTILSEISILFKNNDSNRALFTIMEMLKGIKCQKRPCLVERANATSKYSL